MSKSLIALPCTARELEDALHRVCDHEGTWDGRIEFTYERGIGNLLIKQAETKGENT